MIRSMRSEFCRKCGKLEHDASERTAELLHVNKNLREEIVDRARAEQARRTSEERLRGG